MSSDGFWLAIAGGPPNTPGLLFQGLSWMNAPFGSGILCATPHLCHPVQALDATGGTHYAMVSNLATPGQTLYYQYWFRDPQGPCPGGFNLTNGWEVTWH